MKGLVLVVLLGTSARADTLALGPHGGVCADCKADDMYSIGGGLEAEHRVSTLWAFGGEVGLDAFKMRSDECPFAQLGQRASVAGRVRLSSENTPGFFVALAVGPMLLHEKTTCQGSRSTAFFGFIFRPQVGWDFELAPHRWLRLEVASGLQFASDVNDELGFFEIEAGALFAFAI